MVKAATAAAKAAPSGLDTASFKPPTRVAVDDCAPIVTTMKAHPDDTKVQLRCIRLIACASLEAASMRAVLEAGGITALAQSMQKHQGDLEMGRAC